MWKYIGQGTSGITGVPAQDLTDEEFIQYDGKLTLQFPTQPHALKTCGLYEYVDENPQTFVKELNKKEDNKKVSDEDTSVDSKKEDDE